MESIESENLTIIIPTLNEEQNIGRLCDEILKLLPQASIMVVDDGSSDETQQIASNKGPQVTVLDRTNEPIHGLTISIRDGILKCKTKMFMVIDGDFQHPPESLIDALECFKKGGELVLGYRIKVEDWPFTRKLMSFVAQNLGRFSLMLRRRQRPKDLMSGFFGGQIDVIQPLITEKNLALKGYKLLFDVLKILPREVKIEQFGYIFKNREFGTSKIGKTQIWEFFKSVF